MARASKKSSRPKSATPQGYQLQKIISYGDHSDTPHPPVSILMTRLAGRELGQAYESLDSKAKTTALTELQLYLSLIRGWKSPWGEERVCSISGGAIRNVRVPDHKIIPCETPEEFHESLLKPGLHPFAREMFASEEIYQEKLRSARRLRSLQRPGVKFTHGDMKHHSILVDQDGHITGLIDWESAGWYPEFWEYTTALRFLRKDFWWYEFLLQLGAEQYLKYMECERALTNLTVDSYSW